MKRNVLNSLHIEFECKELLTVLFGYDTKYDNSPKWRRWRNHLESMGMKVMSSNNFRIRFFNAKVPTMFGNILIEDISTTTDINDFMVYNENGFTNSNYTGNEFRYVIFDKWVAETIFNYGIKARKDPNDLHSGIITKFEENFNDEEKIIGEMSKFIKLFDIAVQQFEKKEFDSERTKSAFGQNVNETFIKLGVPESEISCYWENIKEKRLLSPFDFHSMVIILDSLMNDCEPIIIHTRKLIIDAADSEDLTEIRKSSDFNWLPKHDETSIGILKSFAELRF